MTETKEVTEVVNFSVVKYIEFSSLDKKQEKFSSQVHQILSKFIRILSHPLIFTKTSDEQIRIDALSDIVNSLCKIMRIPLTSATNLKIQAVEVCSRFFTLKNCLFYLLIEYNYNYLRRFRYINDNAQSYEEFLSHPRTNIGIGFYSKR